LDSQRSRFQAESDLVDVDFVLLSNRVNLHRALGGGWADPGPVMVKKETETTKDTQGD
jgi:multidrug efflux system outer membrane protein